MFLNNFEKQIFPQIFRFFFHFRVLWTTILNIFVICKIIKNIKMPIFIKNYNSLCQMFFLNFVKAVRCFSQSFWIWIKIIKIVYISKLAFSLAIS